MKICEILRLGQYNQVVNDYDRIHDLVFARNSVQVVKCCDPFTHKVNNFPVNPTPRYSFYEANFLQYEDNKCILFFINAL